MATSRSALVYADFLLPHLTSDTSFVDVGCGNGELSLELAAVVRQITGVDSNEDDIQACQARGWAVRDR